MLGKRSNDIPALFGALSILKKPFNYSLLEFLTTIPLAVCDFHKTLEDAFYGQRLRFSESEALPLLCLESNVSRIPMLVV